MVLGRYQNVGIRIGSKKKRVDRACLMIGTTMVTVPHKLNSNLEMLRSDNDRNAINSKLTSALCGS